MIDIWQTRAFSALCNTVLIALFTELLGLAPVIKEQVLIANISRLSTVKMCSDTVYRWLRTVKSLWRTAMWSWLIFKDKIQWDFLLGVCVPELTELFAYKSVRYDSFHCISQKLSSKSNPSLESGWIFQPKYAYLCAKYFLTLTNNIT